MNPFIFDRPVGVDDLIDRDGEAAALLRGFEQGANTRLSSPRRYGKTSLLGRALDDAERAGMARVYVDLYGTRTVEQVHARVERAYEAQLKGPLGRAFAGLRRARGAGISTPLGGVQLPASGGPAERALLDLLDLPRALHERTGTRVALAFDEFQEILAAGQGVDGLIRSVIQHHGAAASYVFAGSHPGLMAELFSDRARPFYGQAAPLVLGRLDGGDLAEYVGGRFEQTGRDAGGALTRLIDLADGHPQRAMLLAHLLWNATRPGSTAGDDEWVRALDAVEPFTRDELEGVWGSLSSVERGVAEAVGLADSGLTSSATLRRFGLTKGAAPAAAARLVASGVLVEDSEHPTRHRLVDPLFARWVANDRRWG